jgi:fumarate reductase flavoprotein subunit
VIDVDLLVAGAGGGLAGALRAAELGRHVVVVEADRHYQRGNNTAMSTAMIPGAGSRYQRAAGIEDSATCFLADIERKTGGGAEPVVARALAEVSAELVEWLADRVGLPLELATDVSYPGHSVPRVHTVPGRHGSPAPEHRPGGAVPAGGHAPGRRRGSARRGPAPGRGAGGDRRPLGAAGHQRLRR